MADTIYILTNQAIIYIESLKEIMDIEDTLGTNLITAIKILAPTPSSENLRTTLLNVYTNAKSYCMDSEIKSELDSILVLFPAIDNNHNRTKIYFDKTPTVAAKVILSKFQNNCVNIATILLSDIKNRLKD